MVTESVAWSAENPLLSVTCVIVGVALSTPFVLEKVKVPVGGRFFCVVSTSAVRVTVVPAGTTCALEVIVSVVGYSTETEVDGLEEGP